MMSIFTVYRLQLVFELWCLFLQYIDDNLSLMSVGFLLSSPDDAVIWRGPKKNGKYRIIYQNFWNTYAFNSDFVIR